ncbi:amidase family protein [Facklamia hominis]|uniref:Amidase family protein n=1 Tax=Facklamia hominis TaxID=178214 RepID=A0AAJ1Q2V9_9LACT|nr:amidase family protein [Facklamia hominis]MDK7186652.1 amidase family protein [Facklamia hominis]
MKRNLWHQRLLLSSLLFPLVLNAPLSQVAAQEPVTDPVIETTVNQLEETVTPSETPSSEGSQAEDQPLAPFTKADYETSSATQMAQAIRQGRVTSEQLVNWAFEEIEAKDGELNAMISTRKEAALKEARELEDQGQPFYGVPLLLKGLGHTIKGGDNTNGLTYMEGTQSRGDSRITKDLKKAGFIVVGQTNYPELGLKNISDSKLYGRSANGLDPQYAAGGSSGGSAAGIAAHYAPVASGSDAGGSIRIPASWNGLIGYKPSRGVLDQNPDRPNLQVVHFPLTKNMTDTIGLFDFFGGSAYPEIPFDPKTIKIAYSTQSPVNTDVSPEAQEAVHQTVAYLKGLGFSLEEVAAPIDGVSLMHDYYTLAAASGSFANFLSQQKRKQAIQFDEVDPTTWVLYQYSQHLDKKDTKLAWQRIHEQAEKMKQFRQNYPLYLTPSTAFLAPKLEDPLLTADHLQKIKESHLLDKEALSQLVYDQWLTALRYTPFTQLANLTGEPAISLPTYQAEDGRTLGVQFQAGMKQDRLLLAVGQLLEQAGQFYYQKPSVPAPSIPEDQSEEAGQGTVDENVESENPSPAPVDDESDHEEAADQDSNLDHSTSLEAAETDSADKDLASNDSSEAAASDPSDHQSQTKPLKSKALLPETGETSINGFWPAFVLGWGWVFILWPSKIRGGK